MKTNQTFPHPACRQDKCVCVCVCVCAYLQYSSDEGVAETGCGDDICQLLGETGRNCDIRRFVTVMCVVSHSVLLLTVMWVPSHQHKFSQHYVPIEYSFFRYLRDKTGRAAFITVQYSSARCACTAAVHRR